MVQVLKAVCILFTATVVLFALVNFVAAYLYPRDTRAVVSGHPVFNEATRATYERIYQLPISVMGAGRHRIPPKSSSAPMPPRLGRISAGR